MTRSTNDVMEDKEGSRRIVEISFNDFVDLLWDDNIFFYYNMETTKQSFINSMSN